MTENTKLSALAFSVLVLGMLGFCVALALDVFYSGGASAVVAPATPTPLRKMQNSMIQGRAHVGDGIRQDLQFNWTGRGQFLPEERAEQLKEVVCCRVPFEHASPTLAGSRLKRIGENGWMIDWGLDWSVVKESLYWQPQNHTEIHGNLVAFVLVLRTI